MVSIEDLKIGTVIDIYDPFSFDDKRKYSVIVGMSDDKFYIATVFINSPELVALQYAIAPPKYRFLTNKSFIDCSVLTQRIQSTYLQEINSSGRILGQIAKDDLKIIINLVLGAETILPYHKKIFNVQPV